LNWGVGVPLGATKKYFHRYFQPIRLLRGLKIIKGTAKHDDHQHEHDNQKGSEPPTSIALKGDKSMVKKNSFN